MVTRQSHDLKIVGSIPISGKKYHSKNSSDFSKDELKHIRKKCDANSTFLKKN